MAMRDLTDSIIEDFGEAVVVYDDAGLIFFANSRVLSLTGYSVDETIGQMGAFFLHPDDRQAGLELFHTVLEGPGRTAEFKQRIVRKDAEVLWIEVRIVNRLEDPRVRGIVSYFRDISQEVEREAMLRRLQRRDVASRLVSDVAHDFNNILTVIQGFGEVLNMRLHDEMRSDMDEILRAADRAADLTRHLLAFSTSHPTAPAPVDVHALLVDLTPFLRRLLSGSVALDIVAQGAAVVYADPLAMHQLIMNLVVNGRDAVKGRDDGRIVIRLAEAEIYESDSDIEPDLLPGSYCEIVVSDNGVGIPPDVLPCIFDPFFTTKSPGEGTGLGLAITKAIAEDMRGVLRLETTSERGTTFRILLPRLMAEVLDKVEEYHEIPRGSGRVLVVDHESAILRFLTRSLAGLGYTTMSAEPDKMYEVLERQGDIDLLLIGGRIATHDSHLVARVRARGALPVVVMSGSPKEGVNVEAEFFLKKPFGIRNLATVVRQALDQGVPSG